MTAVVHPRVPARAVSVRGRTWWGRAWVRALEETAYAEGELRAARVLARGGRVGAISVDAGGFVAAVEDERGLWTASGSLPALDDQQRDALVEVVAAEAGRVASLLDGELPHPLVEHAEQAGVELLPYGAEITVECTCSSWTDRCTHALAVLYQLTWLVESDPFVLLHLRGLPREELLALLHRRGQTGPQPQSDHAEEAVDPDLDAAADAALRAARVLELLAGPSRAVDHLF